MATIWPSGSSEPGEFSHDKAIAALQDAHQLVEPPAFFRGLTRSRRLDEVVDGETLIPGVLENGEALAANALLRGGDPEIGDGFHGLSREYGFLYFALKIPIFSFLGVQSPKTRHEGSFDRYGTTKLCRFAPSNCLPETLVFL